MQTPHFDLDKLNGSFIADVLVETLRTTANAAPTNLLEIAQTARTTPGMAARIISDVLGVEDIPIVFDPANRLRIALEAGRFGASERVARALSWQEFEKLCDECLTLSGFETRRGLVFKHESRRWQIDLVATRERVLLSVDCKHWQSPAYSSRIQVAAEHQKESLRPLIEHLRNEGNLRTLVQKEIWALPMILTLMDPRESHDRGVAVVSLSQLPDLVSHLTPYDPELPFIYDGPSKESPISQSV